MMPNYITFDIQTTVSDAYNSKRGLNKNFVTMLIYYGSTPRHMFFTHKPNLGFIACIVMPKNMISAGTNNPKRRIN